jgi:AcrR family transcriptional regulator
MSGSPARRSQAQRSAETIAALVSATIDALVELGSTGTTVREITKRAGLSQGALFRHFESRNDLILAAVEEIARRHVQAIAPMARRGISPIDLRWFDELRRRARRPESFVWVEVLLSARRDLDFQRRAAQLLHRLDQAITELAAEHPVIAALPPAERRLWVTLSRRVVQGGALLDLGLSEPRPTNTKLHALERLYRVVAERSGVERPQSTES